VATVIVVDKELTEDKEERAIGKMGGMAVENRKSWRAGGRKRTRAKTDSNEAADEGVAQNVARSGSHASEGGAPRKISQHSLNGGVRRR
jgi:hypothetical protein